MKFLLWTIAALTGTALASPALRGTEIEDARDLRGNSEQLGLIQKKKDGKGYYCIPVEDGAWGQLRYRTSGLLFDYTFNGHNLKLIDTKYTLVIYCENLKCKHQVTCLGDGVVNNGGNVNIVGVLDTGTLKDVKIWLGPSVHFDCKKFVLNKDPKYEYFLFEENLISYEATAEP